MSMQIRTHRRQEQGTVLLVSLILLLVMSLFGVTSLNGAALDEEMARNLQHEVTTFHVAESVTERVFDLSDPGATGYSSANDLTLGARTSGTSQATADYANNTTIDPTSDTLDVTQADATVVLTGSAVPDNFDLKKYRAYLYRIDAQVALDSSGSSELHRTGAQKIGLID